MLTYKEGTESLVSPILRKTAIIIVLTLCSMIPQSSEKGVFHVYSVVMENEWRQNLELVYAGEWRLFQLLCNFLSSADFSLLPVFHQGIP